MERTTILIPAHLRRRLVDEARRRKVPQSELIREALARYLGKSLPEKPRLLGSAAVRGVDAREAKRWVRGRWDAQARPG